MKVKNMSQFSKISLFILVMVFVSNIAISQTDTTSAVKPETTNGQESSAEKEKKEKKKRSEFIAYASATFNQLSTSSTYESIIVPGWALGAAYKHGRFFYWQVGARYNNAVYEINLSQQTVDSIQDNIFSVKDIDIPVTAGLNLLYFTGRAMGLRIYVSAVPAFVIGVGDSDYPEFNKDDLNSFNMYGQGGLGFDFLFLSIDAGYNYGFTDVFKNEQSTPGQIYVNLGFRF